MKKYGSAIIFKRYEIIFKGESRFKIECENFFEFTGQLHSLLGTNNIPIYEELLESINKKSQITICKENGTYRICKEG